MKKNIRIIRSSVTLATLHNRRDFSKRNETLAKFSKTKEKGKKENA